MRVDLHTHLWPASGVPPILRGYGRSHGLGEDLATGHQDLLAAMDACDIERSVVLALAYGPDLNEDEIGELNDHVRNEVGCAPDRLVGFCTVNPFSVDALGQLRRNIEAEGFRGLKLHGSMQRFDVDDERLYPLYEAMEDYRLPILFHSGGIGVLPCEDRHTRATRFDAVACAFPSLPIILGHAGRIDYTTTAELLRKHQNVYAEVSSNIGRSNEGQTWPLRQLFAAVAGWAGGTNRLAFGSDYPLYSQADTLAVLAELHGQGPGQFEPFAAADVLDVRDRNGAEFLERYGVFA